MPADPAPLPLQGIRVIDFGQYVAGPLAGMLLAEQGAEVIRIVRPGQKGNRYPADVVLGRGKKSVCLDLGNPKDAAAASALIKQADILIENFRPGLLGRFGLGIDQTRSLNPGLIHLSLPGFARGDRRRASVPGWEGVVGAATALYTGMNMMRGLLDMAPVYTALPLPSVYAGVQGALAVTMALHARGRAGGGETIELPLANAMMSAMGGIVLYVDGQPARYDIPPIPRLIKKLAVPVIRRRLARKAEVEQEVFYEKLAPLIPPMMDSYICRDGRLLFIFAMDHARMGRDLLEELGLLERFAKAGLGMSNPYAAKASSDRKSLSDVSGLAMKWRKQLRAAMTEAFLTEDSESWEARLNGRGIPCAVQRSTDEWLDLPAVVEAGLVEDIADPTLGQTRVPGPSLWLQGTHHPANRVSPGFCGQECAFSSPRGDAAVAVQPPVPSQENHPPLHGVRILDLSTMVAGPICARTLGEYGAEVIKIDSPAPLLGPRMTSWYGLEVNQGKKSVLIDLKKPDGNEAFRRMVRQADVVIHNMRPGVAERLGIDYDTLRTIRPDLIYCNISAYSTGKSGSWDRRPGYDPVLQAATGIMTRFGRNNRPEMHGVASCVDYVTGFNAAFGITAALVRRSTRGMGARVFTSLAQGAHLAQITHAYRHEGRVWTEPAGQGSRGEAPLNRLYRTKKGWLYLVLPPGHAARLLPLRQFEGMQRLLKNYSAASLPGVELDRAMEVLLLRDTARRWEAILQKIGIGAHRVVSIEELRHRDVCIEHRAVQSMEDAHDVSTAVIRHPDYPEGMTTYVVQAAAPKFSSAPMRIPALAPKLGDHSRDILGSVGFSPNEVDALFRSGAAANSLSSSYLPK